MSRVKVIVLSDSSALALVQALVPAFASAVAIPGGEAGTLGAVVDGLVRFTLEQAYPDDELGEVEVTLEADDGSVRVEVHDWGRPLASAGGDVGPLPPQLEALSDHAEGIRLINLGADGKRLVATCRCRARRDGHAGRHHVDAAARPRRAHIGAAGADAIEVRRARPDDAEGVAQLLYENYHLSYVHPDFYRPRFLSAELEAGRLVSTIGLHEGRVIGHHALMPVAGLPSAETGAAVVHSAYRGLGIFGRLFEHTLAAARERRLAAVYGDAVTIHPFSQRAELSHGYRETALQLGMVPAHTTMRGLGTAGDGHPRRTATVRSYRLFAEEPRQVALPTVYRAVLESVYANLDLQTTEPGEPVRSNGDAVSAVDDEQRRLGFLRIARWDDDARSAARRAIRRLLSRHDDVVYADLDLASVAAPDEAVEFLNRLGFCLAGLVVHGPDDHDHLRLQLLDAEDVELETIVCDSPFAQRLRQHVLDDLARVTG